MAPSPILRQSHLHRQKRRRSAHGQLPNGPVRPMGSRHRQTHCLQIPRLSMAWLPSLFSQKRRQACHLPRRLQHASCGSATGTLKSKPTKTSPYSSKPSNSSNCSTPNAATPSNFITPLTRSPERRSSTSTSRPCTHGTSRSPRQPRQPRH